jgi:hypothetical protein
VGSNPTPSAIDNQRVANGFCPGLGVLLFVGHFLHPVGALAVEPFDKGDVGHRRGGCGTVPVLLPRRKPDDVTRMDFFDRAYPALHPAASGRHDQDLAQRVGVPCGPTARLERYTSAEGACRFLWLEQRVNAHRAGEILGRSLGGWL